MSTTIDKCGGWREGAASGLPMVTDVNRMVTDVYGHGYRCIRPWLQM